ncbi:MAG TPA: hypothetical protein PLJ83_11530 [Spirochaetales bacterium]|nr:hypothetical protein [Spirochaetales bacterium]
MQPILHNLCGLGEPTRRHGCRADGLAGSEARRLHLFRKGRHYPPDIGAQRRNP